MRVPMRMRRFILAAATLLPSCLLAQSGLDPFKRGVPTASSPLTEPTLSPGALQLLTLEGEFAQAVAKGGGAAFAAWFADDAVTLNNGKMPVLGKAHIAEKATWKPNEYQLTWQPENAQMGPSGDMGYTWGHYDGTSKDRNGNPVVIGGRYITIWKRMPDGKWKVAMEASAEEPAAAGECCKLPAP